jgi:hypothetical protein
MFVKHYFTTVQKCGSFFSKIVLRIEAGIFAWAQKAHFVGHVGHLVGHLHRRK